MTKVDVRKLGEDEMSEMGETKIIDGVEYTVVPCDLPEGDKPLGLDGPKWPFIECLHENTKQIYFRLESRNDQNRTVSPAIAVESKSGRVLVCVDCWAVKSDRADGWSVWDTQPVTCICLSASRRDATQ